MRQYVRVNNKASTDETREATYAALVSAMDNDEIKDIGRYAVRLYSMLIGLPENSGIKKDMRTHYYPNMREWRKTVETRTGDRDSLDAYKSLLKTVFQKFGYEL